MATEIVITKDSVLIEDLNLKFSDKNSKSKFLEALQGILDINKTLFPKYDCYVNLSNPLDWIIKSVTLAKEQYGKDKDNAIKESTISFKFISSNSDTHIIINSDWSDYQVKPLIRSLDNKFTKAIIENSKFASELLYVFITYNNFKSWIFSK